MSENGKGDKPRPKDTDKWDDGWKSIKWDKPKGDKKQREQMKLTIRDTAEKRHER